MKWQLLVTRETDLFERYLRMAGYNYMLGDASKFKIKNLFVVNNDGITAQYVYIPEIEKNHNILWKEYKKGKLKYLPKFWQQIIIELKKISNKFRFQPTKNNFKNFLHYYFLSRGIVFYTEELSRLLESKKILRDIKILGHWHESAETESSKSWDNLKKKFHKFAYYLPNEFEEFLENRRELKKSILKERKKYYVMLMMNGKIKLYLGKKAKEIERKEIPEIKISRTDSIQGNIASKGYAKGRVRIVNNESEMKLMKKGEILVSLMTTPRLMMAVKKAAAIVTNEGGITSHAAIVSREFNIPCIIGTRIATKVFKDGDLVEVDANKGIVRKIK